jgi:hypothetical protein
MNVNSTFLISLDGVRLSPFDMSPIFRQLHQPRMIDDDERGAIGGMIGKGNRSTERKPVPLPLCPRLISHDLNWDRTQTVAVGSRYLTARAMARS